MSGAAHGLSWDDYYEKFGTRIARLEEEKRNLLSLNATLARDAQAGKDFKVLMQAINSNPTVKAQWDRVMVAMRLSGLDKTPE